MVLRCSSLLPQCSLLLAAIVAMSFGCAEQDPGAHSGSEWLLDAGASIEEKALPGSFKLRNEGTAQCVRRSGSVKVGNGYEVQQASCSDNGSGMWWRRQCVGSACQYVNGDGTSYCLKASGTLKASGGSLNVYAVPCTNEVGEKWSVKDLGSGRLQLRSQRTGNCAYASQGEQTAAGVFDIVQRACGTDPKFLFKQVAQDVPPPPPPVSGGVLKIAHFSVGSADSALIVFPNGKTMMVDSATPSAFANRVLPFMQRHGVKRLDYYSESHDHPDHVGGEALMRSKGYIDDRTTVWDWNSHKYEDTFTVEGTKWFVYNARDRVFNGTSDANENSFAFRMEYNGFVYTSGGDEGLVSMNRFLREHPDLVRAHVRKVEHHLWGPVSPSFIKATDPALLIASTVSDVREEDVFDDFIGAVNYLKANKKRLKEYVITEEVGNVIVRASSGTNWSYEFCSNISSCIVPNFP